MLKKLGRLAKNMECILDTLPNSKDLVEIKLDINNATTSSFVDSIRKTYQNNGLGKDNSPNPSLFTYLIPDLSSCGLSPLQEAAIALAHPHVIFESGSLSPSESIWASFLGVYSSFMGALPLHITENGKKRFFLKLFDNNLNSFAAALHDAIKKCGLSLDFDIRKADGKYLYSVLQKKLTNARNYYLASETEWSQEFYASLGDDLSRSALLNFLQDRMRAKVIWDCDIYYTVTPTLETAKWRMQRLATLKSWPVLHAPDIGTPPFAAIQTFVFEQYRAPGIVETLPGDTVVDAGAGCGDTSLYFSNLMGNSGEIISLEPFPDNVECMKENFKKHNCTNITIVPKSVGNCEQELGLYLPEGKNSLCAGTRKEATSECLKVRQTTLDRLAHDKKIDFVKADIEGGELAMLSGARETILRDAPAFALALYHKENDWREFPQFLQALNNDYTFYIRVDAEPMFFARANNKH